MPIPLLNAETAPEGAVLWLQMLQEQHQAQGLQAYQARSTGR